MNYQYVQYSQPHPTRRREILAKYPEILRLFGPHPLSALYIALIVAGQWAVGYGLQYWQAPWWGVLAASYLVGAFAAHALYVMIHECCHNLVFGDPRADKLMGMACDLALVFPSAMGFRRYHLVHHTHLGEFDHDADLVDHTEGRLVGNSPWRKALWIAFFMFSQGITRPLRLKNIRLWERWTVANLLVVLAADALIYFLGGPTMLAYLALSTFFALGLHPLGGRWIQEHYITKEGQETYSYYGPLNKLTFNMGMHNEHHDFFMAPWVNLPKIRALAPEHYDGLAAYKSWTGVLWNFIWDKRLSPFSRVVHTRPVPASAQEALPF